MKQKVAVVLLGLILGSFLLAGCSDSNYEEPVDLTDVETELKTVPETIKAGETVELQASFTGIDVSDYAMVTFDFRIGEEPILVDVESHQDGVFSGNFEFPEQGTYDVYVHLFDGAIHIVKKKTVEVQG